MAKEFLNNAITKKIGRKVFILRRKRKLSRESLAHKINISQQQLFKYEMGYNRITVDKLFDIALALDCNISEFFPPSAITQNTAINKNHSEEFLNKIFNLSGQQLADKFIMLLNKIED